MTKTKQSIVLVACSRIQIRICILFVAKVGLSSRVHKIEPLTVIAMEALFSLFYQCPILHTMKELRSRLR